jgi:hypothetical protein
MNLRDVVKIRIMQWFTCYCRAQLFYARIMSCTYTPNYACCSDQLVLCSSRFGSKVRTNPTSACCFCDHYRCLPSKNDFSRAHEVQAGILLPVMKNKVLLSGHSSIVVGEGPYSGHSVLGATSQRSSATIFKRSSFVRSLFE